MFREVHFQSSFTLIEEHKHKHPPGQMKKNRKGKWAKNS